MDFDTTQPIYKQIMEEFKKKMIRGELKTGDKILSQREYAQHATINPNTVQRAYREMENIQLVETLRGQGTFVSVSEKMLDDIKKEMAKKVLNTFIFEMKSLGFSSDEICKMITGQVKEGNDND